MGVWGGVEHKGAHTVSQELVESVTYVSSPLLYKSWGKIMNIGETVQVSKSEC